MLGQSDRPLRAGVVPTAVGEWWQFRGNRELTGRAEGLCGRIDQPAVAWKHFCGTRETLLGLRLSPGSADSASLPTIDLDVGQLERLQREWGFGQPWYDLDGDGHMCAISPDVNAKIGAFLPDEPGLQRVEFESVFTKYGTSAGKEYPAYGRLYTRRDGSWQEVWRSANIPILFISNAIVGDFDRDGKLEVAVTPWYDLRILDLETGRLKYKARFKPPGAASGRAYGWLGAYDLDQSGRDEFVILADFENHIEVLGWVNGRFRRRWHKLIERGITRKTTALRPGTSPVQDITGDGNFEIVVSIFNQEGDGLWHIVAMEGITGRVLLDLPGQYLSGMADVDGDGVAELFCTAAPGAAIPTSARLSLMSLAGGRVEPIWHLDGASFQMWNIPSFASNVNSGAATGRETVLAGSIGGDETGFVTCRASPGVDSQVELTVWGVSSDRIVRDHVRCVGPGLAAVALRNNSPDRASILVQARVQAEGTQSVSCDGARAELLCSHTASIVPATVVVGRLAPEAKPTLIAQGSAETLVAFRLSDDGTTTERVWLSKGRVQSPRAQDAVMDGGVLLADLTGDGNLETIAATACPKSGCARLVALDAGGVQVWHRDFARFPGPMPPWNVGGLTYYFAGRFTSLDHCDVLVSLRRTSMHSDESFLLSGQTGNVIWQRDVGPCELGCGGGWTAIYDYDGDGLDDAVSFYPHAIWAMDGATGKLLVGKMAQEVFGCSAFYAKPVVVNMDGDARYILFSGTAYVLGLLDQDLNVVWQGPSMGGSPAVMQSVGDMDGDGRLEVAGPGYRRESGSTAQDFCCHDAATGALKWRVALPGSCFVGNNMGFADSPTTPAMADLDGDGRDECVFAIEDTLYTVGATADGGGEICWALKLPDRLGPPSIADVAGEHELQVVVSCADGHVYGIGARSAQGKE
jgi:hypothetical protein